MDGSKAAAQFRGLHQETPLQQYLDRNGIPSARIESALRERLNTDWPSRQQFGRYRLGRAEPRRKDMVRILWAVREVTHHPDVRMEEIFDFDPDNPANWRD